MSTGKITQIIGAVIDVEFPSDAIPKVYNALNVTKTNLTLEVQQQLGDNVVRAIAMGGSEGLQRGLAQRCPLAPRLPANPRSRPPGRPRSKCTDTTTSTDAYNGRRIAHKTHMQIRIHTHTHTRTQGHISYAYTCMLD